MINVCIPVLRRYDLLRELLLSLVDSTVTPSTIYILDNGRNPDELASAIADTIERQVHIEIYRPRIAMGVAASWNWFLNNAPEEWLIANDDILFAPQSLERMLSTPGDLVLGFGYSCYLLRRSCVDKVGYFDESISPGYGYFEDCDYMERIHRECDAGRHVYCANAEGTGLMHGRNGAGSQTWQAGTDDEIRAHWRKFDTAKANFVTKWGAEPHVLVAQREARMAVAK